MTSRTTGEGARRAQIEKTGDGAKHSCDLSEEPATVAASDRSAVTDLWRRRRDEAIG